MYSKIKELCKRNNISISELESELDFPRGSICKWDINVPSIAKVKAVAEYFDITIDELLEDVDKMNVDTISKKLVELRGDKRQEDVAKALNIAQSTYAMYETGKRIPSDKVKMRIADYYSTTVQDIFYQHDDDEGYLRFEELLKEKGVSAYRVAQETGVSTATLTSWKKGVYTPKPEKLQKLADYFGVQISCFINIPEISLKDVPTDVLLAEIKRRCGGEDE